MVGLGPHAEARYARKNTGNAHVGRGPCAVSIEGEMTGLGLDVAGWDDWGRSRDRGQWGG